MMNRASLDRDTPLVLRDGFKVMVVDNNKESLGNVGKFLESHGFEVTCVDQAGTALRMLMDDKNKYDLLFIDNELRDIDVITFLRLTKDLHMIPMVMREEEDDEFLIQAINNGAYLVVKKPLSKDVVTRARQYVVKARLNNLEQLRMADTPKLAHNNHEPRKRSQLHETGSDGAKRASMEWTEELHSKFLRAARLLGKEGRCFPKDILETMGVPGLTRMQIASHLQKCRLRGWEFHGNRLTRGSSVIGSSNLAQRELDSRSYGCKPHKVTKQEERNTFIDATFSTKVEQKDVDHMNAHSSSGSSSTNGHGFQKIKQGSSVPNAKGSNHDSSPPKKESNEFFYLLKNDDVNASSSFTTLDLFGPNSTHEQASSDDDRVVNDKATPVINEHILSGDQE